MKDIRSLLVVGLDVVALASSARNSGYNVFSVDYFGDSDLINSSLFSLSLIAQRGNTSCGRLSHDFHPEDLLVLAEKLLKRHEVDGILLSSGLEDQPQILYALNELAPIIGNSPKTINRVRNRESFFTELDLIGISHPITELAENVEEAKAKACDIGYPVVVKPTKGSGGYGIRKVSNLKELEIVFNTHPSNEKFLVQEYINGRAASASVISTTLDVHTLTINEQLLGKRGLGQKEPFGYSGNVVPLKAPKLMIKRYNETVEKVVNHFHLVGSNGIDFVITNEGQPKVVEVNPRFQGSLECIEGVLGINLVKAHVEASTLGVLPTVGEAKDFYVRLIIHALKRSKIPDLNIFKGVRDVPLKGVIVEEGEPLCSIIAKGKDRNMAFQKAGRLVNLIYRFVA
ncbi:MAG: ATP-grasp domain-containing protein [Candidatus Bathyarchaeota archaeon]